MQKNSKKDHNQLHIDAMLKECNQKKKEGFNYTENIVLSQKSPNFLTSFNISQINPVKNQDNNIKKKNQISFNNKQTSIFNSFLGRKKEAEEITEKKVNYKNEEIIKKNKEKKKVLKAKKNKKGHDWFLIEMDKRDKLKKRKEENEEKQAAINDLLQRNIMGDKERKFMTQNEEQEERLKKEKEIRFQNSFFNIDMSIPIPFINPMKKNNLDKYKSFRPMLNDIYKNVLDFNFYNDERHTEEIPNTFENEAHYRYVWIMDFFNELKYCLLNEKIEKSEIQNYEEADIKIDLTKISDYDDRLVLMRVNTNKKLYELKKRIFKDNDIIAIYNEKCPFDKNEITLKNEHLLNYFLGIVTRDFDSNDLNLLVLRQYYAGYSRFDIINNNHNNNMNGISSTFDKKIKYLGSINSSLREYKALFDLELSNFTGIIKTDSIFLNSSLENLNSKPVYSVNNHNYYLSEKEIFLKNLQKSPLFNEPQKNAIYQANLMKKNEILLIQGPPGTGKTHTILGLISMLLKNNQNSKILVCAPSNAAIDEISARLATIGVYDSELKNIKCKFLRFGLYDRKDKEKKYLETLNGKILEKYSLEYLSEQKYKKDIDNLSERLENLRKQLNNYNKEKEQNKNNDKDHNNKIAGYIKNAEAGISNCLKLLLDKKYQKSLFEQNILISSPILCTTLNNAGNERLKRAKLSYEYLIIDEASQCVEPLCLIPLCHDVKKLILVGDHMQLPATVFYPKASKILYNRSLFERLIDNKYPRYILTVQYRMQKNISEFISKTFYDNKLTNDENHVDKINKEIMYDMIKIENNFSFFDVQYGEEFFEDDKKSYINENEIKFSFSLIKRIISEIKKKIDLLYEEKNKRYKKIEKEKNNDKEIDKKKEEDKDKNKENNKDDAKNNDENKDKDKNSNEKKENIEKNEEDEKISKLKNYKFAIICAYKSQVLKFRELKKKDKFFMYQRVNDIEINTVDSFQGQERDIIIFSTVRANFKEDALSLEDGEIPGSPNGNKTPDSLSNDKSTGSIGIGFLNDFRRMNVGLSRAKIGCFVVGHYETLKNNNYWKKLMNYCKEKNSFFKVEKDKESDAIDNILKQNYKH